jgi:hypothetical protein
VHWKRIRFVMSHVTDDECGQWAEFIYELWLFTHGAEPFLRCRQLCSYSRTLQQVHYRAYKSPSLVPILSQINPILSHPISLRSILVLSTHLRLSLPSGLFPSRFHANIPYAFLFSTIRVTCPAHLILPDMIILIILDEEYKLLSSSLCSFLQPSVTSSLFDYGY